MARIISDEMRKAGAAVMQAKRQARAEAGGSSSVLAVTLLAKDCAARGEPLPSREVLSDALEVTANTISTVISRGVQAGLIRSEGKRGPYTWSGKDVDEVLLSKMWRGRLTRARRRLERLGATKQTQAQQQQQQQPSAVALQAATMALTPFAHAAAKMQGQAENAVPILTRRDGVLVAHFRQAVLALAALRGGEERIADETPATEEDNLDIYFR